MTTNFFTHARLAHGYWRAQEWGLDDQGFLRMIQQALALGIRVFDHAACYGGFTTEEMFGRGLALEPSLREQMCIVSKCGILFPNKALPWMKAKHYDNSRKHIVWSAERSVRSLQCGYRRAPIRKRSQGRSMSCAGAGWCGGSGCPISRCPSSGCCNRIWPSRC